MKQVIVNYKVKPDRVAENEALVQGVYEELERGAPGEFRYATFKLEDGVSFAHVASIETPDGSGPLPDLAAFKEFQRELPDRCDEQPVVTEIEVIGSYRFFQAR